MIKLARISLIILAIISLSSCEDTLLDSIQESVGDYFCPGSRLEDGTCNGQFSTLNGIDFTDSSAYTYDSDAINVTTEGATLKGIPTTQDATVFANGTQRGVEIDSGSNRLALQSDSADGKSVMTILSKHNTDLIAYYPFTNGLVDESGNAHHLTGTSGTWGSTADFAVGPKSYYAATAGYAENTSFTSVDGTSPISGCAWAKHSNRDDDNYLLSITDGSALTQGRIQLFRDETAANSGHSDIYTIYFRGRNTSTHARVEGSTSNTPTGVWTHVCFTMRPGEASGLKLYINGTQSYYGPSSSASITDYSMPNPRLQIGAMNDTKPLDGYIDEVALWNAELSADDIKTLYQVQGSHFNSFGSTHFPQQDSLLAYYPLNGDWNDHSGNGLHSLPHNNGGLDDNLPIIESKAKIGTGSARFDDDTALQYAEVPNSTDLDNLQDGSFTLSAWYRPDTSPNNNYTRDSSHGIIMKAGYNMGLRYLSNKKFMFNLWASDGSGMSLTSPKSYDLDRFYHVAGTVDTTSGRIRLYVDGIVVAESNPGTIDLFNYSTQNFYIGSGQDSTASSSAGYFADGHIDDVAIWKTALSESEVRLIHRMGQSTYAGYYESPVYQVSSTSDITGFSAKTPVPFLKSLSLSTELQSQYTDILGDLTSGLQAYYPILQASYDGTDNEVVDIIGGHHGKESSATFRRSAAGVVGRAFEGGAFAIPASANLKIHDTFTISVWINSQDINSDGWPSIFTKGSASNSRQFLKLQQVNNSRKVAMRLDLLGSGTQTLNPSANIIDGEWHHILYTSSGTKLFAYFDGQLVGSMNLTIDSYGIDDPTSDIRVGTATNDLYIDEIGLWSRQLTEDEIQQLYRRTANHLHYFVRSCSSADCSDADWIGGTGSEAFSELLNTTSLNSEGFPMTASQATAMDYNFQDLGVSLTSRPYFQYKVLFGSRPNESCGSICLPELENFNISSAKSYLYPTTQLVNTSAIAYKSLGRLTVSASESCDIGIQLSTDNSTYYHYDSGSWKVASDASSANTVSQANDYIRLFGEQFPKSQLYVKVILSHTGSSDCTLKSLNVKGLPETEADD